MSWFTKLWSRDGSIHPDRFTDAQWEELIAYTHENQEFPFALYRMKKTPRRSGRIKVSLDEVESQLQILDKDYDPYGPWKTKNDP